MDAISSLGSFFQNSGIGKLAGVGSGVAGTIGNIFASQKRNQVLNQSLNNQSQLMALANNPTALATQAGKLQQPLSAGLTSGVGNAVQAYLAERGLSQSPGIASETLAQGLAPYQLQEQQLAMNSLLQSLGLPAAATPRFLPYPQSTDLSKIFQSIFSKPDPSAGAAANSPAPQSMQQIMAALNSTNSAIGQPSGGAGSIPTDMAPPDVGQGNAANDSGFDWMNLLTPNSGGLTFGTT